MADISTMTDEALAAAIKATPSGRTHSQLVDEQQRRDVAKAKAEYLPLLQSRYGWTDFTVTVMQDEIIIRRVRDVVQLLRTIHRE